MGWIRWGWRLVCWITSEASCKPDFSSDCFLLLHKQSWRVNGVGPNVGLGTEGETKSKPTTPSGGPAPINTQSKLEAGIPWPPSAEDSVLPGGSAAGLIPGQGKLEISPSPLVRPKAKQQKLGAKCEEGYRTLFPQKPFAKDQCCQKAPGKYLRVGRKG